MMTLPILSMKLSETMRLLLPLTIFLMVPMMTQCRNQTDHAKTSTSPPNLNKPGVDEHDKMDPVKIGLYVFLSLFGIMLCFIIVIAVLNIRHSLRRNKKFNEMQERIQEKEERKRLLYEMQVTEELENHKRELMASEQRSLFKEMTEEGGYLQPELNMALYNKEDGYLKVQDIKAEHQKMINAKTVIASRALVAKLVAAMAEVDGQAKNEDLVDVPKERCMNPEVKTLKATQVEIVPVESQDKFKDTRKFNMNSVWILDKTKAFIGQLPPQEVDLFTIVMREGISVIVVEQSLMYTYLGDYIDMDVDQTKEVDLIKITCLKLKTLLWTRFVVMVLKLSRGDLNRECVMLFIPGMPSGDDARSMREMEDCCSIMQLHSWDSEPSKADYRRLDPNLLFLDSNGTGNAVTLLTLYICRQTLFHYQCINAHYVLKHISRSRYGCWVGMDSLQVTQALGVIYGALEAARKAVVAGDAWNEKKRKKREAKKKQQERKEKMDLEKSGFSFRRLTKSGKSEVDLESGLGESMLSGFGSMSQSPKSKFGKSVRKQGTSVKEAKSGKSEPKQGAFSIDGGKSKVKGGTPPKSAKGGASQKNVQVKSPSKSLPKAKSASQKGKAG